MSEVVDKTLSLLRRIFTIYIVIAAVAFAGDVAVHRFLAPLAPPVFSLTTWGYSLFVIALLSGIALPIMLRANFQKNAVKTGFATLEGYRRLQRLLLVSVFIAALSADIAYLFPVQVLYLYGAFFAALYGIYSVIPYRKKLLGEMRFYKLI